MVIREGEFFHVDREDGLDAGQGKMHDERGQEKTEDCAAVGQGRKGRFHSERSFLGCRAHGFMDGSARGSRAGSSSR